MIENSKPPEGIVNLSGIMKCLLSSPWITGFTSNALAVAFSILIDLASVCLAEHWNLTFCDAMELNLSLDSQVSVIGIVPIGKSLL